MGRYTGGGNDREDFLKTLQILRVSKIGPERFHLFPSFFHIQDLSQFPVLVITDPPDILHRYVVKIFIQILLVIRQKRPRVLIRNLSHLFHAAFHTFQLAPFQVSLKRQLLHRHSMLFMVFQQPVNGFFSLLQIQQFLIPAQQTGQPLGPLCPSVPVPFQGGGVDRNLLRAFVQFPHPLQRFLHLFLVSQADDRKRDLFPSVSQVFQFFHHAVDGMVIVRGQKHRLLVEKRRQYRIEDRIGLSRSGRPLDISHRIFHGIVDRQQLVQIQSLVQEGEGDRPAPPGTVQQFSEKCFYGNGHLPFAVHLQDPVILFMEIHRQIHTQSDQVGQIVHDRLPACRTRQRILDLLLISLKIIQKLIVFRIQKPPDTLHISAHRKFPADRDIFIRPEASLFHVQPHPAVSKHIQSL